MAKDKDKRAERDGSGDKKDELPVDLLHERDWDALSIGRKFMEEYRGLVDSRAINQYLRAKEKYGKAPYHPIELRFEDPQNRGWLRYESALNKHNFWFIDALGEIVAQMPDGCVASGDDDTPAPLPAYWARSTRPRVGIVTDEFMFNYYNGPFEPVYLYPETYEAEIDSGELDFVLYITCWHGRRDQFTHYYNLDDGWWGEAGIVRILDHARSRGVPVVFQSIEDPPSYELFRNVASHADVVLTSCEEVRPNYVRDLGLPPERVATMRFGVNPQVSNPLGMSLRRRLTSAATQGSVMFAGSWYDEFPGRCADTRMILDALIEMGRNLFIFDRRWPVPWGGIFPHEYWHYVVPGQAHHVVQRMTRLFDFAVNLNTVKDSTSMCAMRTFELPALGVTGIANDALALATHCPELVRVGSKQDVFDFFAGMSETRLRRSQFVGIRRALVRDDVFARTPAMFHALGMTCGYVLPRVAVLCEKPSVSDSDRDQREGGSRASAAGRLVSREDAVAVAEKLSRFAEVSVVEVDPDAVGSVVGSGSGSLAGTGTAGAEAAAAAAPELAAQLADVDFVLRLPQGDAQLAAGFALDALLAYKYADPAFVVAVDEFSDAAFEYTERAEDNPFVRYRGEVALSSAPDFSGRDDRYALMHVVGGDAGAATAFALGGNIEGRALCVPLVGWVEGI